MFIMFLFCSFVFVVFDDMLSPDKGFSNNIYVKAMDRREYTPTKVSQLNSLSGVKATERTALDRSKLYPEQSRAEYTRKSIGPNEIEVMKEYEALKMKVRQM